MLRAVTLFFAGLSLATPALSQPATKPGHHLFVWN